jgi:hypothetical protein
VPTGFVGLEPKVNRLAVASFVLSLAFPLWPLSSIAGVVLGIMSMKQVRQRPLERGFGLAVAGLVIGLAVLIALAIVIAVLLYFGHACQNGC